MYEHTVKIYSLLIDKDLNECRNEFYVPCVYFCLTSDIPSFFGKSFPFLFLFLCYFIFTYLFIFEKIWISVNMKQL